MVKWLPASLLIAIVLAALPGPVASRCASMTARVMGCAETAPALAMDAPGCCSAKPSKPVPAPAAPPVSSCCAPAEPAAIASCADEQAPSCAGDDAHQGACSLCMVLCGTLCDESASWALLGLASDGLAHAAPSVLLAECEWLPRPTSQAPPPALAGEWLTFDRPRRQARLCLWTV